MMNARPTVRGRLLSVVLVLPVLLAWLDDRKGGPIVPAFPRPGATAEPSTPPSTPPSAPASAAPASSAPVEAPAPSESPAALASPASPAPSPAPSASASPAAGARPGRKPSNTPGMATLEGHVFDSETKQPVNKSEVTIPELSLDTFSQPNGRFSIKKVPVREKPYEIMIIHPGYENLYDKKTLDREERFKFDFFIKKKGF